MTRYAVGQSVPRTEDPRLLKGAGKFVDDFNLPYQTYAYMLRSPHAHAEIKSIDKASAEAVPGVLAVLTGQDYEDDGMGHLSGATPRNRRDGSPAVRPPRPAVTKDRARYVGQIVAVVVAETLAQAKDAAEVVEIDYEILPANVVTELANQSGTPQIWDDQPNNEVFFYEVGDKNAVDAAISSAVHVMRQRFIINRITANTMEPRGALGDYDPGLDRYTIYTGHQRPFAWRTALCKNVFKIPENKLRLVTGDLGGSFGMKGAIYPEIPLVAWASKRIGRPVKWNCERSEGLMADDHGRDNVSDVEFALDGDGKFLALRVCTTASIGAYISFLGMGPSTGNIGGLAGVYTTPAMHVEVTGVFTNNSPISPYRGAGRPEASFIMESMIRVAAHELGIDQAELRRRNFIPPNAFPYKTPLTFTYDCGEFAQVMAKAMGLADYDGFAARREASEKDGKLRGLGMSCTIEQSAGPSTETAELRFDPSGTVTLLVGSTPHGQGHETIYKQLVSEKLVMDVEDIIVIEGDTDKVSFGTGTGGSRTATLGASAVNGAVAKVINKGLGIAAHILEVAEGDVTYETGKYTVAGTDKSVEFSVVAAAAFVPAHLPKGMEVGLYETATYEAERANFPNGCHICEVEITRETGAVQIVDYNVVDDVGFELNPLLVHGQVHGGIAQGAGQALMEDMVYEPSSGQMLSGSFMDYAMPRAENLTSIEVSSHPVPTDGNPLGVKGAGEAGTVGALPATMNAIHDALQPLGIEHIDMPATSERIWQAIREAAG